METEIRLTPNLLKAIGERTRLQILQELASGPKMPADISRKLNKTTPTIIEHLDRLVHSGLVERSERPNRKYVFYSLTQTGQELISNRSRLSFVLYGSIIMFVLGVSLFAYGSLSFSVFSASVAAAPATNTPLASTLAGQTASTFTVFLLVPAAALVMAFILLLIYVLRSRQIRFRIGG